MNSALSQSHKGRYVAIEGMPGTGKSTIIDELAATGALRDYRVVFEKVLLEPAWLSERKKSAEFEPREADDWYLEAERERSARYVHLIRGGSNVVSDRSCVSHLAFAYARAHISGCLQDYRALLTRFLAADYILLPDQLLVLVIPVEHARPRLSGDRTKSAAGPWANHDFLHGFARFYERELPKILPTLSSQRIVLTGANVRDAIQRVLESLKTIFLKAKTV